MEAASHIAKGKQRGMTEFCGHFAMHYPGPHEQNSRRRRSVALVLWWYLGLLSSQEQLRKKIDCPAIHCHLPDCIYSALLPLTINELTVLLFKTSSSNCSLSHVTCHLFEDVGPANYSFSNPNNSTTTFIQEKPLSHLSIWSVYQPLNYSLCFHACPSSPRQLILNIAVR